MATTTINASKSTWLRKGDAATHGSDTNLYTAVWDDSFASGTNRPVCAVMQFTIPNTLRYKRFKKATLSFYHMNPSSGNTLRGSGLKIAPFVCGDVTGSLTWDNRATYGQEGQKVTYEDMNTWDTTALPRTRTADVTDIFVNNLYQNTYFTIFVFAYPGIPTSVVGDLTRIPGANASSNKPTLTIDYEDVVQSPPSLSYPADVYVNENVDINFSWNFNSTTQAVQAAAVLEYKLQSAGSYTVVNLPSYTAHSYTLAGGLQQGAYEWRVKVTNDAGETSGYSEVATFNVIGKPATPVINAPTNNCRTTITWQASDQNAYDIKLEGAAGVLVNESVSSATSSYKPNMMLANGTYTVSLRVKNSSGLFSDWAYKTFNISATGPAVPTVAVHPDGDKVHIDFSVAADTVVAIMRKEDGKEPECLAILSENATTYTDSTAACRVEYTYFVRAVTTGYTDSAKKSVVVDFEGMILESEGREVHLYISESEYLPYNESIERDTTILNFYGREFAFVERGEFTSQKISRTFYVTDREKKLLTEMLKTSRGFYRDSLGNAFSCALSKATFMRSNRRTGFNAQIEIVRIQEEEVEVNV